MNQHEFIIAQVSPSTGPVNTQTQTQTPGTPNGAKQEAPGGIMTMMLPILLIIGLYVLFMRPQYKKEKQLQASLKKLTKGDKVVTRGGLWGVVVGVKDEEAIVVVKIAENVKVEVSKTAIESINPELKPADKGKDKKAKK